MIDRIDFSNSIENLDEDNIVSLFDSVMTLYGIIGTYDNIKISNIPSSEVASFDIVFEANNGVADVIVSQCNHSRIDIFGNMTTILCNKGSEELVHIQLIKD